MKKDRFFYSVKVLTGWPHNLKQFHIVSQFFLSKYQCVILNFCSIIFERLSKNGKNYLEATSKHLNGYGEAGLRTLALSYRKLDETEYSIWNSEFHKAKTSVGADRDEMLEKVSDMMEKELILVGATAVEDKLQKGVCSGSLFGITTKTLIFEISFHLTVYCSFQVPQCIDKLAQAGLKIWVLTGDKMETAINIGCAVLLCC